jgi:hypothetical protein
MAASNFFIPPSNTSGSLGQGEVREVSRRLRAALISDYFAVLVGDAMIFCPVLVGVNYNPIAVL